ncbi:bacillithiol system redox-active protein YtxJ [Flavobacterium sp. NKUCC04_CG]|uniref:bacillithiol system redox-active protein YtxJ n=1 Tax=Flavobacterium sp. NKUCC04_CG TaxID=2842121 RepID=UPI001C5BBA7A|nr:bacillithiol system redox-active protein YtxJ [Flavobacterium sp. NKUCC04_CG]MBW3519669.1 bacillithiol system redox-active protein YtxJ [Flavobacterium sp. NKUCC04_CG]
MKWIQLESEGQLKELALLSEQAPVLIFKHSTKCYISKTVLKNFENSYQEQEMVLTYFLDLIAYRAISNKIAEVYKVEHQSPQLIAIYKNEVIYHASHSDIDADTVFKAVNAKL